MKNDLQIPVANEIERYELKESATSENIETWRYSSRNHIVHT